MCGRYASFREAQDLADAFAVAPDDVAEDARSLPPSWNLAPTDAVRIVVERVEKPRDGAASLAGLEAAATVRSLRLARWGLVPGWAKDPSVGNRMINARVETVADKPAFRTLLEGRRCLVPAEGYYEWTAPPHGAPRGTPRQPHWIHPADGRPVAFAGLYAFWRDPARADDDPLRWLVTTTILTAPSQGSGATLEALHDRRPVILDPDLWQAWLDPGLQDGAAALGLVHPPMVPLEVTPVATTVNRVGTDGPGLLTPV